MRALMRRRFAVDQREEDVFQAGRRRCPALLAQFGERALGDQPAVRDDADALGHPFGDFEDMRRHDRRCAPRAHAFQQHVLDLARGRGVEPGQRFIEDDQLRVVDQRAGQRHLLPHALGKALAALVQRAGARPSESKQMARVRFRHSPASMPQRPATNSRYSSGVSLS